MKKIILLGPKHSGKTSAGKALANLCSCGFFDSDELILQKTGKTPRQLYSESVDIFQKAEVDATAEFINMNKDCSKLCVFAAGGGFIDNDDAVSILTKEEVIFVCLNISANKAWSRISGTPDLHSGNAELPPFLRTENPQETHRVLHERRNAACLKIADVIIEINEKTPEEIASEIYEKI